MKSLVFFLIKLSCFIAALWFLVDRVILVQNQLVNIHFSFLQSLSVFFFTSVALASFPFFGRYVLQTFGYQFELSKAWKIYFKSQLAKYLPGGIWAVIGRGYYYHLENIHIAKASQIILFEMILFSYLTALAVIPMLFIYPPDFSHFSNSFLFSLTNDLVIMFIPYVVFLLIGWFILSAWHKKISSHRQTKFRFSFFIMAILTSSNIFYWTLHGIAMSLFPDILHMQNISIVSLSAIYGISWLAGFVVFVTPAGLGVREAVMIALLLMYGMKINEATIVTLLSRFFWLIAEFVFILLSFSIDFFLMKFQRTGSISTSSSERS